MDKVYVDVLAVFSREGELIPKAFVWEDGHRYEIDKISKPERCASRKAAVYILTGEQLYISEDPVLFLHLLLFFCRHGRTYSVSE